MSSRRRKEANLENLWLRATDAADHVACFLPTKAIAALPCLCKATKRAQPRVLFAAARNANALRECTSALLDTLYRSRREGLTVTEAWDEGALSRWQMLPEDAPDVALRELEESGDGPSASYLELSSAGISALGHTSGLVRWPLEKHLNLAVTRLSVRVAYFGIDDAVASSGGYVLLCGPLGSGRTPTSRDATEDFIAGLYFMAPHDDSDDESAEEDEDGVKLVWLYTERAGHNNAFVLRTNVALGDWYTISATFSYGPNAIEVSVNGEPVRDLPKDAFWPRPLAAVRLYNYSSTVVGYSELSVAATARPTDDVGLWEPPQREARGW